MKRELIAGAVLIASVAVYFGVVRNGPPTAPTTKVVIRDSGTRAPSHSDGSLKPASTLTRTSTFAVARDAGVSAPSRPIPKEESPLLGLDFEEAGPSRLTELKVPEGMTGVVITRVDPASPAAEVKLQAGDVIVRAQRSKISDVVSLEQAIGEREHTLVTVYRDGFPFNVMLHKPFRGDF